MKSSKFKVQRSTFNVQRSTFIVLAVALTLASCKYSDSFYESAGPQVTDVRPLSGFERVEISGSPTVVYAQADSFSVRLEGPEKVVADILTSVDGGTLSIRNKGKIGIINFSMHDQDGLCVYVTSPDLIGVQLNGSGDFKADRRVDSDNLRIVLRGSGDIGFKDIICDHCTTELVGSGDIDIDRLEAQTSSVSLIGSGNIDIKQWNVGKTDIALKGSGDISVDFREGCGSVGCRLVGSGDIELKGQVRQMSKQKSGSGDIDTSRLSLPTPQAP